LVVIGLLTISIGVLLLYAFTRTTQLRAVYNQASIGMTMREVDGIVQRPPGRHRKSPGMTALETVVAEGAFADFTTTRATDAGGVSDLFDERGNKVGTEKIWFDDDDDYRVCLYFDLNDILQEKLYLRLREPESSISELLRALWFR
jgi:hypothetical protein